MGTMAVRAMGIKCESIVEKQGPFYKKEVLTVEGKKYQTDS